MRKQMVAMMIAALPLAALSQGGAAAGRPAQPQGQGQAQTAPAPGAGQRFDPERMEKRMRLARTLGLAEALDLDAPQALKLGESIARFDDRRLAAHKQIYDARQVLRRAAQGEKVAPADVDTAIQKVLDARAQIQTIDRETVATVTKDLTPEKKARAVLFLSRFHRRFGPMMGPGMMHHGMGQGMGPGMRGRGMGPGGGMGPGMMGGGGMGMAPPAPDGDEEWEDEG